MMMTCETFWMSRKLDGMEAELGGWFWTTSSVALVGRGNRSLAETLCRLAGLARVARWVLGTLVHFVGFRWLESLANRRQKQTSKFLA
jgi:hypothetical protein